MTWHGRWIKYGRNLSQPRYPELFENPRILVRQIPSNKTYAIEAVYVDEDVINDVNSATITDIQINPFYLLGVINSKLLTLWFMMKFDKFQRRIFPQFKANELGDFPIPDGNEEQQTLIAELVQKLMGEMKKEEKEESLISTLNTQIDESVMELFGLTEDEKQSVRDFEV